MAGQSITFDFLTTGADRTASGFKKVGDNTFLAAKGAKILSNAIETLGDKEGRTAAESALLAKALRQTGVAEDRVAARAVLADAAIRRLDDAMQDSTKSSGSLSKALGGLKLNPGLAGPALLLAPAMTTLAGAAAAAGAGLGGAFIASAGALAAFGAIAKPVLTDAGKASEAVAKAQDAYTAAIASGVPQAKAFKAEQLAIAKAYAGMSPAQIALSKQLGDMADAWDKVKAAQTPVVAGALQPWLKAVTGLTAALGPIIAKVAPVIASLGTKFDSLVNSSAFTQFRDFIGSTGAAAVSAGGSTIIDLVKAFMILLPKFDPLIREAVGWISRLGPAVLTWASSKKTADQIQSFLQWFSQNGPAVGEFLRNIGGALKALAPGLTSGGLLELKVVSDFLGFVARLPPGLAKPLAEVAGAMLILQKTGVVSVGIKLTGLGAGAAGAGAAGGPLAAAGAGIAGGLILKIREDLKSGWQGIVRDLPQWLSGVGGILNLSAQGWSNAILNHFATPVRHMWASLGHFLASSFDITRGQVAGIAGRLGAFLAGSFAQTRQQVARIWDVTWNNTVARAGRGVHDVAGWLGNLRAGAALTWGQIRSTAAAAWNTIWNNTVTRVANGITSVVGFFRGLPGKITSALGTAGTLLAGWGKGVINGLLSGMTSVISAVWTFIKNIPGKILSFLGIHSPPQWAIDAGKHIMNGIGIGMSQAQGKLVKATAQFSASALAGAVAGPGGGAPAANAALARKLMPAWGSGAEWAAWNYLAMRESGWNQYARNPSSGAYGIPQALPPSKMGAAANPPQSNPAAQIRWMIGYIQGRYGDPIGAAAHERAYNWYAKGTAGAAPGWGWVGERGPELVNFRGGEQVLPAGRLGGYADGTAGAGAAYLKAWQSRHGGGFGAAWGPVVLNQQIAAMAAAVQRAGTLSHAGGLSAGQHRFWASAAADETKRLGVLGRELTTERAWRYQLGLNELGLDSEIRAAGSLPSLAGNVRGWKAALSRDKATVAAISKMLGYSDAYLAAHPAAKPGPVLPGITHTYGGDVANNLGTVLAAALGPFTGAARGGMVMDRGGWLRPGWNPPSFNGTGRPEQLVPARGGGGRLQIEWVGGNGGDDLERWIKKNIRVRGGGDVQRAWGSR